MCKKKKCSIITRLNVALHFTLYNGEILLDFFSFLSFILVLLHLLGPGRDIYSKFGKVSRIFSLV